MKSFLLNVALICAIFSLSISAFSQSAYERGWAAFNKNDRDEAEKFFTEATAGTTDAADAWLSLSMLQFSTNKDAESHQSFLKFIAVSTNPYPAVYSLWSTSIGFSGTNKLSKEDMAAFKKMMLDPKCNGTIKAMISQRLGDHQIYSNQHKKGWLEYDKVGSIQNWQVTGTFDNTSGSGFNKTYGPLEHPEASAEFANKVDALVKWYDVPEEKKNRWFDFETYFYAGNSIMYAQTFVNSPSSQKVWVHVGVSGSVKVWVNDKLILKEQEERNNDLDTYISNAELNSGYNRVLVQIGNSEAGAANFLLRMCDENGNPIKGLTGSAEVESYDKAGNYTSESKKNFAEEHFEGVIKENPTDVLSQLLLANVYLRNDKKYESRKTMKAASALAPTNTCVSVFAIQAFARDNNVTDLTKEREKVKKNDPKGIITLQIKASDAWDREDFDEHEKLINEIEELYGKTDYIAQERISIMSQRQKYEEQDKAITAYYKTHPDDPGAFLDYYALTKAKGFGPGSVSMLQKFMKKNNDNNVEGVMLEDMMELGMYQNVLTLLEKKVVNEPHNVEIVSALSSLNIAFKNYSKAQIYADKYYAFRPYIGESSEMLGNLAEQQSKNTEAEKHYERAIYLAPTSYDAREQLRKLQDKEELFDKFEKVDAEQVFKDSPPASAYPDDDSHMLIYDNQRLVYPEGASEEKVEILIKVHNQAGIDRWKEYRIYSGGSQRLIFDKAEVFKADGGTIEAERNSNYAVFTDLEVGDAIHLSYRLRNYNYGKLSKHIWDQYSFQYFIPAQLTRYSMLVPKDFKFQYEVMNGSIEPRVTDVEDMKLYVWEATNQKSLKSENAMPPLVDIAPTLDISTMPDWKFVANWYNDLSTTHAKQDFEIKETVAEVFKDAPANQSELEKARMIYNHIVQNVSYSQVPFRQGPIIPQKASRTLRTKLGDCKDVSTLFVAMCKEVGIKANLLLVDTKDNGRQHMNLPSIDFNHCIARAICDGKTYYVELTNQKLSFTSLPDMDVNATVLLIPNDVDSTFEGITKLSPKNRPMNSLDRITELSVEGTDLIIARRTIRSGDMASSTRGNYADIGKEEQEKDMTRAIATGHSNQVKLLGLSFGNLQGREDTIHYNYRYKVVNEVNDVVGMKIFKLPWADKNESLDFISLESRKYPFVMFRQFGAETEREVLTFTVPTGKTLAEVPKNAKYACSVADYSISYVKQGNKLVATREFKVKKEYLEVKDYDEFKEFFNKVMEADTKQIALK